MSKKCWRYFYNAMSVDILIFVVSARSGPLEESANEFRMLCYETSMLSTNRIVILNSLQFVILICARDVPGGSARAFRRGDGGNIDEPAQAGA